LKTKNLSIKGIAILAFIGMAAVNKPYSGGAPSASTGAPQEQSCAMSTCHDDKPLNLGPAILSVELPENIVAGQLVPVKVSIKDDAIVRFGFQLTVLDEFNKRTGKLFIKDSLRTQIIGSKSGLPGREYLTYTYLGTSADKPGYSEWEAYWEAPSNPGKVTFYLAGVSANNDGEDKGDNVYTSSKEVNVLTSLSSKPTIKQSNFRISKMDNSLIIQNSDLVFVSSVRVSDLSGKILLDENIQSMDPTIYTNLKDKTTGIVSVTLYTAHGNFTKKIFLND